MPSTRTPPWTRWRRCLPSWSCRPWHSYKEEAMECGWKVETRKGKANHGSCRELVRSAVRPQTSSVTSSDQAKLGRGSLQITVWGSGQATVSYMFSKSPLTIVFVPSFTMHWEYIRDQDACGHCLHRDYTLVRATDEEIRHSPWGDWESPQGSGSSGGQGPNRVEGVEEVGDNDS